MKTGKVNAGLLLVILVLGLCAKMDVKDIWCNSGTGKGLVISG